MLIFYPTKRGRWPFFLFCFTKHNSFDDTSLFQLFLRLCQQHESLQASSGDGELRTKEQTCRTLCHRRLTLSCGVNKQRQKKTTLSSCVCILHKKKISALRWLSVKYTAFIVFAVVPKAFNFGNFSVM